MILIVLFGFGYALGMFVDKYRKEKRTSLLVISIIISILIAVTLHIAWTGSIPVWRI